MNHESGYIVLWMQKVLRELSMVEIPYDQGISHLGPCRNFQVSTQKDRRQQTSAGVPSWACTAFSSACAGVALGGFGGLQFRV